MTRSPPSTREPAVEFRRVYCEELKWIGARREHLVDQGLLPPWQAIDAKAQDVETDGTVRLQSEAGSSPAADLNSDLCGLAISGGGIRSATFALGVLQGLAMSNLLPRFDYLSTVSGGGYIGAWLLSWIHRSGFRSVLNQLLPFAANRMSLAKSEESEPNGRSSNNPEKPEPKAITHLRFYSNYLAPKPGLFSLDGWVLVAIFLRNMLLNQAVLLLAILGMFIGIRGFVEILAILHHFQFGGFAPPCLALAAIVILIWATWKTTSLAPVEPRAPNSPRVGQSPPSRAPAKSVSVHLAKYMWQAVISWLIGAILIALFFTTPPARDWVLGGHWWVTLGGLLVLFGMLHALLGATWICRRAIDHRAEWDVTHGLVAGLSAGLVGGLLQYGLLFGLFRLSGEDVVVAAMATFGVPLVLVALVLTNFLQIGVTAPITSGFEREWWSSHNARLMIIAAFWCLTFLISVYAPSVIAQLLTGRWTKGVLAALTSGWIGTTLAGLIAANSAHTRGARRSGSKEWIAHLAPYVFALGLLALIAFATTWLLCNIYARIWNDAGWEILARPDKQLSDLNSPSPLIPLPDQWLTWPWSSYVDSLLTLIALACLSVACLALSQWMGTAIGVNRFTLQHLYANRLVRCYLGATRPSSDLRKADPVTNFDPRDDLPFADLAPRFEDSVSADQEAQLDVKRRVKPASLDHLGPLHIVNAALNRNAGEVAGGNEAQTLAFLERKAESFVFTPLFCGSKLTNYCWTREFAEDLKYGAAISISGAAVSPNMGFYSSAAVTVLLTAFNVRLGAWFGTPSDPIRRWMVNPPAGWDLLVSELLGDMRPDRRFVYLSDGGHFENLGVYELIRRHCRFIVVIDAGADPRFLRENLGHLLRKVRIDLGIDIDIDVKRTETDSRGRVASHVAVGRIRYGDLYRPENPIEQPAGDPRFIGKNHDGILLYLKTGLTGDEAADLLNYSAQFPNFPNETTLDQFYSESQFESYRVLGVHTVRKLLEGVKFPLPNGKRSVVLKPGTRFGYEQLKAISTARVFEAVYNHWLEKPPQFVAEYVAQNQVYLHLIDKLRTDPSLSLLARELYGDPPDKLEASAVRRQPEQALAERLMINEMMTLLESAWLGLDLEQQWMQPVHEGWITVFKNWTSSASFLHHWPMLAQEFSPAFRQFVTLIRQEPR